MFNDDDKFDIKPWTCQYLAENDKIIHVKKRQKQKLTQSEC